MSATVFRDRDGSRNESPALFHPGLEVTPGVIVTAVLGLFYGTGRSHAFI